MKKFRLILLLSILAPILTQSQEKSNENLKLVLETKKPSEFETFKNDSKDKVVVICFSADWCGYCKQFKPTLEELAKKYPDTKHVVLDIDIFQDIATEFKITALPTFFIGTIEELKKENLNKDHIVTGADKSTLETKIKSHISKLKKDATPETKETKTVIIEKKSSVKKSASPSKKPACKVKEKKVTKKRNR